MRLKVLEEGASPVGAVGRIDEAVMIPDLLRSAPQVRPVLDRYGLRGCGGRLGPVESLGFFAQAHGVPLDQFLRELREALAGPAADASPAPRWEDAIYRPFFKAGIVVVLTLGAVWGAYLLLRIGFTGSFSSAGLHEVNAHGHAQIFGWVGLFVMGFAYQAFPRFKHAALALPRLALASLGMMLAGLVGRSVGEPLAAALPWAGGVAVASAWLEVAAVVAFAGVVVATWRASGKGLAWYDYYILSSLGWFVVQAVFEAVYLGATLAAASREELLALVATWQGAMRETQIHGFALLMILGVSQHALPHFYGLPAPSRRLGLAALVGLNLAVVGEVAGLVFMRGASRGWAAVWYGSALLLAGSVAALVWNWGVFGRAAKPDRSLKFVRAAYAWLLISLAMLVLLPAYQFVALPWLAPEGAATSLGFSHAYYGAVRHAITVGFVSLMIVGVSSRVVPTLNGVDVSRLTGAVGAVLAAQRRLCCGSSPRR
ncbi:MAG: NnrS family protein [Gemmataceae bacterium]